MDNQNKITVTNLARSFAGEAQARTRYTVYAGIARKEGYEWIARIFEETAANETVHAEEFLEQLQNGLGALTESDARERLNFYSEMIDDRMEEGLSEQEAVAQIGDVNEIIASILDEIPQRTPEQMPAKIEQPAQQK